MILPLVNVGLDLQPGSRSEAVHAPMFEDTYSYHYFRLISLVHHFSSVLICDRRHSFSSQYFFRFISIYFLNSRLDVFYRTIFSKPPKDKYNVHLQHLHPIRGNRQCFGGPIVSLCYC
jgi:hypothetical protein